MMQCTYCEWHCELGKQKYGVCRMYHADHGEIRERFPGRWTCSVSPVESVPFYHAYPGSRSLAIGTNGRNFRCRSCSNAYVALQDTEGLHKLIHHVPPEELVRMAQNLGCNNIIFNCTEPVVAMPSLLKLKTCAEHAELSMGCITNAYGTQESMGLLVSVFDFVNVRLKGFSSNFYREHAGVKDVSPILRNLRWLAAVRHLEVTTQVVQGANECELELIAEFLSGIDREIPWHVFRLLPEHNAKNASHSRAENVSRVVQRIREKLNYVYFHNLVGSNWVDTLCPDCGAAAIERFSLGRAGYRLDAFRCNGNLCPKCGRTIKMHGRFIPALLKQTWS
jgi:pyruvate formate lyase activating enzyme